MADRNETLTATANALKSQRHLRRLQWCEYQRDTDQITPLGHVHPANAVPATVTGQFDGMSASFEVIRELTGWPPFTHLIRWDGTAVYSLVTLADD